MYEEPNIYSNVYEIQGFNRHEKSLKEFESQPYIKMHKYLTSMVLHRMHFIMFEDDFFLDLQKMKGVFNVNK